MIPTRPADCNRAGIPTQDCPVIEPTTYTAPIIGQWNNPDAGLPPELFPALVVGAPLGAIDPPLPGGGTVQGEVGFAPILQPLTGPPTPDDVPATWAILGPLEDTGFVGFILPLMFVSNIAPPGVPFWLRLRYVDELGCESFTYVYVASGAQEEPSEIVVYALADDELYELTILPPEEPLEPGPATDPLDVVITPICPPPAQFVPVGPACGQVGVPVALGLRQQHVVYHQVNPDSSLDLDGSTRLVIRRVDDFTPGGTAGSATVHADPAGSVFNLVAGQELVLEAAPGWWLNRVVVETGGNAVVQIVQTVVPTT